MSAEARTLWSHTRIRRWPGRLVLVSLSHGSIEEAARLVADSVQHGGAGSFAAIVVEVDEVSLTIDESMWHEASQRIVHHAVAGPYAAITLVLDIDLGVCGYLLPAARRLAEAGISIVPQCAYRKDHLLIREEHADLAVAILERLVAEAAEAPNRA